MRQAFDLRKITLLIPILLFSIFLSSFNAPSLHTNHASVVGPDSIRSSETQDTSLDSVVRYLLDASAKDFHDNQPPVPVGFRNVQIKHLITPNEEMLYLICGQFLVPDKQNKEEWTPFATIKTSGYEQWIGSHAAAYCQNSKMISYKISDLSAALKGRFDALQNSTR